MELPPHQILLLPTIKAEDTFTLTVNAYTPSGLGVWPAVATDYRGFFSHNGATTYTTLYTGKRAITYIQRGTAWQFLAKPSSSSFIGEITYTCSRNDFSVQCTYGSMTATENMKPAVNLRTASGHDLSCLVLGTYFHDDYSAFLATGGTLKFTSLSIESNGNTVILGQDQQGRFYDRKRLAPIVTLDASKESLVYQP